MHAFTIALVCMDYKHRYNLQMSLRLSDGLNIFLKEVPLNKGSWHFKPMEDVGKAFCCGITFD